MALEGKFLVEVQRHVAELTEREDVAILDAATGAGEAALQIAQAMNQGTLISVDSDPASWHKWTLPAAKNAGVLRQVKFVQADVRHLPLASDSVDLVVCDATLSALGIYASDAISEFGRVLKPAARLALRDLIPEKESESDPNNISALGWRLAKAAAHLAGEEHYEELPTDWVRARLREKGFKIISFESERSRRPASKPSYDEWRRTDPAADVPDENLRAAIRAAQQHLVHRAETEGLTTKTGYYACWAQA